MSDDDEQYWKVLKKDGRSTFQGFEWPQPKDGEPGAWIEVEGKLAACENGLHLTDVPADWLEPNCVVYLAEYEGEMIDAGNKIVVRKARLVRQATEEEMRRFHEDGADDWDDSDDDDDWDDDWDDEDEDWDSDDEEDEWDDWDEEDEEVPA